LKQSEFFWKNYLPFLRFSLLTISRIRLPSEPITPAPLKELQIRIARGEEAAFTQLYFHFGKRLILFGISLVRSREIAEELVEDVFVRLWANREHITEIENISVYMYVAVKNKALNKLSEKAKELITAPFDYLDTTLDEFAASPYDLMITSEMMVRMHQVIETLPPRCKMIFKLIREDGLKYKEVAEILNISVNTIDAQMAIAVRKICMALHIEKPVKNHPEIPADKKEPKKNLPNA